LGVLRESIPVDGMATGLRIRQRRYAWHTVRHCALIALFIE